MAVSKMFVRGGNKRGQVTIFIIIALVIIASIGVYFVFKTKTQTTQISTQYQPLEEYYKGCILELAQEGINMMQGRGGYIKDPEFVSGNNIEPLSSQMNFLGGAIPYWFYVKDKTIIQQVPTKSLMEEQLSDFIKSRLYRCNFEGFSKQGFEIIKGEEKITTTINDNSVTIVLSDGITYSSTNNEERAVIKDHEVELQTSLGKMYKKALEIFNNEMEEQFLENYTIDAIRLYAPVDGVELSCSPRVWKETEVFKGILNALEANIPQIRLSDGRDANKLTKEEKYFTQTKIRKDGLDVTFSYSKNWLTKMDLGEGSDGGIMLANPVGNQEGMGVLGFCYVPYHFVYDFDHPVMIQIIDSETNELFQYPVQVIIRGNLPRESLPSIYGGIENDVCKYKNREVEVWTYDSMTLEPVEAQISFKCLSQGCYLGDTKTSSGGAYAKLFAPQCVNGFLTAEAKGYEISKYQISTNRENSSNMLMAKLYNLSIEAEYEDGGSITGNAFIYFAPENEDKEQKTVVIPEQNSILISEGGYNITAYVYENTNLSLPATKEKKCFKVPRPGFGGFLGMTQEQCYDINIPGQKVPYSLSGGGTQNYYITQSQLKT